MRNSWFMWFFIVGVVVSVLIAFNYQGGQDTVPLSDIFPDEETYPVDVEYEFIDVETEENTAERVAGVVEEVKTQKEVKKNVENPDIVENNQLVIPKNKVVSSEMKGQYYTIQVASFKALVKAEDAQKKLATRSIEAYIVEKDLKDKGTWYRLYVGKFDSKIQAQGSLDQVNTIYPGSFVIFVKN